MKTNKRGGLMKRKTIFEGIEINFLIISDHSKMSKIIINKKKLK